MLLQIIIVTNLNPQIDDALGDESNANAPLATNDLIKTLR